MKLNINKIIKILAAFVPYVIAALGGALTVFSGYDDAPGGGGGALGLIGSTNLLDSYAAPNQ